MLCGVVSRSVRTCEGARPLLTRRVADVEGEDKLLRLSPIPRPVRTSIARAAHVWLVKIGGADAGACEYGKVNTAEAPADGLEREGERQRENRSRRESRNGRTLL